MLLGFWSNCCRQSAFSFLCQKKRLHRDEWAGYVKNTLPKSVQNWIF